MRKRLLWLLESASAIILFLAGVLGIIYDILHRFGLQTFTDFLGDPEEAIILLISLLCVGLGIERLFNLRKIEEKIEASIENAAKERKHILDETLTVSQKIVRLRADLKGAEKKGGVLIDAIGRINKAKPLVGTNAIEAAAIRLVKECSDSDHIKATGQYHAIDGLSADYFAAIAERVQQAKRNRGDMEYHVILPPKSFSDEAINDERAKAFLEAGVQDRLITRRAKHPWPFEILIGRHSMIIALCGGTKRQLYELAVKITDHDFVEKAGDWFGEVAWGSADRDDA